MTKLLNSFEGGTTSATISTSNAGGTGNTLFNTVTLQSTGTATFASAAAMHGSLGAQITNAAGSAAYLQWDTSLTSTSVAATLYTRTYVKYASLPASELAPLRGLSSGGAQRWRIAVNTSGNLLLRDGSNTTIATSSTVLTAGTWWRIEAAIAAPNTTTCTAQVVIYAGDSTTPTETLGPLSNLNLGGPVSQVRYGHGAAASLVTALLVDDVAVSDEGWLGPAINVATVGYTWVGAVSDTGATVAYGTSNVTSAQLVVSTAADLSSPVTTSAVTVDSNGNVLLPAAGLTADTQYYAGIKADGVLLSAGRCQWRTDPAAGSATSFSVAFGSCQQTGSNTATFSTILGMTGPYGKARRLIHEGDLHYRDFGSSNTLADIVAQYRSSLAASNLAALTAALPMTYSWDNHDWGGADSNASTPRAADLKAAYRSFVPHYPLADDSQVSPTGAIYQSWTIGRVRFIDLDTRSERSDRTLAESSSKNMLSAQQEAWLYSELLQPEPVKVIICGIYWRQDSATGDRWGSYSTQWTRIKAWFTAHPAVHAYVVFGDRHALCADNGTSPGCYLAQAGGAPFDQGSTVSSEAWTAGYYDTGGSNLKGFGWLDITDGGSSITIAYTGYTSDSVARVQMSTTFAVAGSSTGLWGVHI